MFRRARLVLVAAVLLVLVTAAPAAADPAKPGDYTSRVTRVDPAVPGITVKVVGGDGFLELDVQRGHDVIVKGYAHGPWLHVRPDGVVEENQRSAATYQNSNRYGGVTLPPDIRDNSENTDPPQYKEVATGGTFAWHDHRIHWMSPTPPPNAQRGDVIYPDWKVDMTVDGKDVVVHGQLVLEKRVSPLPWFAIALVVAAAALFLGRGKSTFVAGVTILAVAIAALEIGIVAYRSVPSVAGPNPLEIVLPAVATVTGLLALLLHRKPIGVVAALAAVASLSGWVFMRFAVLFNPVLPTDAPFTLDRAATGAALGASLAVAVLVIRSGALVLHLPELTFDEEQ